MLSQESLQMEKIICTVELTLIVHIIITDEFEMKGNCEVFRGALAIYLQPTFIITHMIMLTFYCIITQLQLTTCTCTHTYNIKYGNNYHI